ncbi:MAG: hypothetical protein ACI92E_001633 [Oceanicoccus sp.]|jgi:hypothetical protein
MIKVTAIASSTVLFSETTRACSKPDAPILSDAATAVTAQMLKAKNAVQAYLAATNTCLECAKNDIAHNRMVKSMKKVGDAFNVAVGSYKERMANS